jgi:dsDNA-specific endonuclease/ATPase MutS2
VSRPVEKLLEFDALKDIVSGFSTCAPGRRATEALAPRQDAEGLRREFALVNEAIDYLRGGSELGLGALADPED